MEAKFNTRNPAVKRIMQEMKEMQNDNSCDFIAEALEGDIFEWHFVIRGPPDTEFEGGVYHGRVLLPPEYPFKPPSFMMLTPSGRFETNVKICLSISSHHPEHWQPSWSIRTALTALIAFMPSPGQGALGSLDFSKDERKAIAARAHNEPPTFGSAERQRVIEDMHQRMLQRMASADTCTASTSRAEAPQQGQEQEQEGQQQEAMVGQQQQPGNASPGSQPVITATSQAEGGATAATVTAAAQSPTHGRAASGDRQQQPQQPQQPVAQSPSAVHAQQQQHQRQQQAQAAAAHTAPLQGQSTDQGLTLLAVALSVCIAAMLLRKFLAAYNSLSLEDVMGTYTPVFPRK